MDGNADYEFVEFYNPTSAAVALTGWSVKKKTSTGNESPLIASSRFEGKIIPAGRHFLAANEGGYSGAITADIGWAKSNTLAYKDNAVVLYDANGGKIEEVDWSEILKGQSFRRSSLEAAVFTVSNPNPQNTSFEGAL